MVHGPQRIRRWHGPREDRGGSAPGAGAAVAGWILASAVGGVGRGRWLRQQSNVVNLIEASRGGVAYRKTLFVVAQ
jgi:hypothetical protein